MNFDFSPTSNCLFIIINYYFQNVKFVFNFRGLVGSKNLSKEDMQPVLEKLKDHLIGKNVASDIAYKLCDSVAVKLEGRVSQIFNCSNNFMLYS